MSEVFICPEYIEIKEDEIILSHKSEKHEIRKPSALELADIHDEGKKIDPENNLRDLLNFQIKVLVDLGLDEKIAKTLNLNKIRNCFVALNKEPDKKK